MSFYRVNLDGHIGNTYYATEVTFTENGHLKFEDTDGRLRMFSRGHEWTVAEVTEEQIEESAYLRGEAGL